MGNWGIFYELSTILQKVEIKKYNKARGEL